MRLRPRRVAAAPAAVLTALAVCALASCAPADEEPTASDPGATASASASGDPADCVSDDMLQKAGTLTVGTDSPAYDPWFVDNDPTNGKGYESAVAYEVADRLGFSSDQVTWVKVPFNTSYAPGAKDFDFDINQISITPARAKVVDFSDGYYAASQAVIALKGSKGAEAASLADLKDLRLGAQTGTTSLTAIRDVIAPATEPAVFEDTNAAKQALVNDQVDAILADLPTAFYISAVEISKSVIVGQFQPETGEQEEFGMLFAKGDPLVGCVNEALAAMTSDGTLKALEKKWLSDSVNVPELQ
ncbi:ABC transporter substrate-binding protein [Nocardioides acrostichi]|uniref:Amino acid ABC transporter substrate-binding protein n=1 Tax=Nocardioides acrostichi TaxID=2784339 RepID=A0A930Y6L3_9ACTN|nr:ABC transporter substrate-binding protein [Nocardioides acrostichi]MBF4161107.1 amino acid ABC transporter substrate-binding protein [Nocardioides acrostichi]